MKQRAGAGPCVLDASVAVAAFRPSEKFHGRARARVETLLEANEEIVVPVLFHVEVVSALVRRGVPFLSAQMILERFRLRTVVLGPRAMAGVLGVVAATRLRAADATYLWTAARQKLPLITDDAELLDRAGSVGVIAQAS